MLPTRHFWRASKPQYIDKLDLFRRNRVYAVAERKDLEGSINLFTPDGVFVDNSVGATYRGRALDDPVRNYGMAFSNMHRELYRMYVDGNVVVVEQRPHCHCS